MIDDEKRYGNQILESVNQQHVIQGKDEGIEGKIGVQLKTIYVIDDSVMQDETQKQKSFEQAQSQKLVQQPLNQPKPVTQKANNIQNQQSHNKTGSPTIINQSDNIINLTNFNKISSQQQQQDSGINLTNQNKIFEIEDNSPRVPTKTSNLTQSGREQLSLKKICSENATHSEPEDFKQQQSPLVSVDSPQLGVRFRQIVRQFSRDQLRSTCQVMKGCKPQKAQLIADMVFDILQKITPPGISTVTVPMQLFQKTLQDSFQQCEFEKPDLLKDFLVSSLLMQSKMNVIVLLAGTSGTGKSTLASLLGTRLGIQNVLSTDSIRHIMRNFLDEKQHSILFCSTYEAGLQLTSEEAKDLSESGVTLKGYKKQAKLVQSELIKVIEKANQRNESIVIEGVHLTVGFLKSMMIKYPTCIPFVLHIKKKQKHGERFAVRVKHMTIDPRINKYVGSLKQIRTIQDYLVKNSEEKLIPRIDNHNVDRSVSLIQTTIMRCLHRIFDGESLFDQVQQRATGLHEVVLSIQKNHLSSKEAQRLIKTNFK